jgi:hypothetical protein
MTMNNLNDEEYFLEILEILKQKFDDGNKAALLIAIKHCLLMNRLPPEWLRWAFVQALDAATAFDIKSWDDVFGRPHPKGTHLGKEKKYLALRLPIYERVRDAKALGKSINKELFEVIGKELGAAGSIVSDIYYSKNNQEFYKLISGVTFEEIEKRLLTEGTHNPSPEKK